jgi:hypothetical protein
MKLSDELLRFLGRLADRLDAAELRGAGKAQSVALNAKTWPELVNAPFESDKEVLWDEVRKLHAKGWVRLAPEAAARSASGYAQDVRVSVLDPAAVREAVGRPERVKSSMERWRGAVTEHLAGDAVVKQAVGSYCIELAGRSMPEVVQRLNGLHQLKHKPLLLREVSARLFWGMSKVLDGRQGLVSAVLGQPDCPFRESAIQLLVQLPAGGLRGALFIENQMSFEQAARSESAYLEGLALVYAAGFKGSAQRLRSPAGASVFYSERGVLGSEARQEFQNYLLSAEHLRPSYFWGDLDWSGMGILKALRSSFPNMTAWSPGYSPMLASLLSGEGHAPRTADKQGQFPVGATGCLYADGQLLPALQQEGAFVDQELFTL